MSDTLLMAVRMLDFAVISLTGAWVVAEMVWRQTSAPPFFLQFSRRIIGFAALLLLASAVIQSLPMWEFIFGGRTGGRGQLLRLTLMEAPLETVLLWGKPLLMAGLYLGYRRERPSISVRVGAMLALLLSLALSITTPSFPLVASQFLHHMSMIVWLGVAIGVVGIAWGGAKETEEASGLGRTVGNLFPLLGMMALIMLFSGVVSALLFLQSWSDILTTKAGFKLLLGAGLFLSALGVLLWMRMAQLRSGFGWAFSVQVFLLLVALGVTAYPVEGPYNQDELHQHDAPVQIYFTHQALDDDRYELQAYVLEERQRMTEAMIFFDVWPDENHREVSRLFDYICVNMNLGLEAWREMVSEQGYMDSKLGEEQREGLYHAVFHLPPGTWHVRVQAESGSAVENSASRVSRRASSSSQKIKDEAFRDFTLILP